MPDYLTTDLTETGYYEVTYRREQPPHGPFVDVPALAAEMGLTEHPPNGYIVFYDAETGGVSTVPSLNPDELMKRVYLAEVAFHIPAMGPQHADEILHEMEGVIFEAGPVTVKAGGREFEVFFINGPKDNLVEAYTMAASTGKVIR